VASVVTGANPGFDYERLEACMAAQYGYGGSRRVFDQAAGFLRAFSRQRPFERGNARVAFLAVTAFLAANGYELNRPEAEVAGSLSDVFRGEAAAGAAIGQLFTERPQALREGATLRSLIAYLCNRHSEALAALAAGDE
jgi:prophage maintenance system killer protein